MARPGRPAEAGAEPGRIVAAGPGRFALSGDVGFADAARLLAEGEAAFKGLGRVEIDLARVSRADSAGLALLLEWSLAARDAGSSLAYCNVPPAIASLAGISDVAGLLDPEPGG